MEAFGCRNGWKPSYIGDWQHPRKQMMVKDVPGADTQAVTLGNRSRR